MELPDFIKVRSSKIYLAFMLSGVSLGLLILIGILGFIVGFGGGTFPKVFDIIAYLLLALN